MSGDALGGAFVLIAIISLGQLVKVFGWLRTEDFKILSTLVFKVTLPAAVITAVNGQPIEPAMYGLVAVGFGANVVLQVASYLLGDDSDKQRAMLMSCSRPRSLRWCRP